MGKKADSKEEAINNLENAAKRYLIKRPGKPEDVAHATVFLAENEFITGSILAVDGGATI